MVLSGDGRFVEASIDSSGVHVLDRPVSLARMKTILEEISVPEAPPLTRSLSRHPSSYFGSGGATKKGERETVLTEVLTGPSIRADRKLMQGIHDLRTERLHLNSSALKAGLQNLRKRSAAAPKPEDRTKIVKIQGFVEALVNNLRPDVKAGLQEALARRRRFLRKNSKSGPKKEGTEEEEEEEEEDEEDSDEDWA